MSHPKNRPTARFAFTHPVHLLAFGFGVGLSPLFPGTLGTLVAVPLYLLLQPLPLTIYLCVTGVLLISGIWICGYTSRALAMHDYKGIVWDELVGYLITMMMAPQGWFWVATGFFIFRFFDILKPWPVGWIDHQLQGGVGIMMDDVLAAFYSFVVLQLLVIWIN
ncbi:MAG: phosphatidylglycerophosphatase A [Gammaproteobacteria bacterium]|nr:phosphatidylglycerophosphatase A [Gammaproteobacteria bacterium]